MKNLFLKVIPSLCLIAMLVVLESCKDDNEPMQTFDPPTIAISSPEIPDGGLEVEVGSTVDVVIAVNAAAGLSSVSADDQAIQTYGGTEISDNVTYQVSPTEVGNFSITFTVIDAQNETASVSLSVIAVEPPVPPFIISDLAGEATGSEVIDIESQGWDIRNVTTFNNNSDLSNSSATIQFVASQGQAFVGVDNPVSDESDKVLQISSVAGDEAGGSWGGHYIFGMISLGEAIPTAEMEALPQLTFNETVDIDGDGEVDASVASVTEGFTRVIQVDAYYDDTVNPNLSLNDIKQLDPIYGLDFSNGYQVDLILAKQTPHADKTTGEVQGMYAAYSAWIEEPNKWVTLTFEVASEAQQQFLNDGDGPNDEEQRNPASIDEVNVATLVPGYSHEIWGTDVASEIDGDTNPLYFRNLRIVNVAE